MPSKSKEKRAQRQRAHTTYSTWDMDMEHGTWNMVYGMGLDS
jgi:hypothetical protein